MLYDILKRGAGRVSVAAGLALSLGALAACGDPAGPVDSLHPEDPTFDISSPIITAMRGAGTIGDGSATEDGKRLQQFDLDVSADGLSGYFDYVDYAVIKEDGNPAHLRVAPDMEGTAITDFVQISTTCVEFDGVGRLMNNGELLHFRARTCDNAQPGENIDVFGIWVPERMLTHGVLYQRGPDVLSDGELTATTVGASTLTITQMEGTGAIGTGEPTATGTARQEFVLDVGLESGVVAGSLDYVDYSVIKEDGEPARLRAGPDEAGTAIATFVQISDTCVEFSGEGRVVNNGDLVNFWVRACDNGEPGVDIDVFEIRVPDRAYRRGPDVLSDGDLVRSFVLT